MHLTTPRKALLTLASLALLVFSTACIRADMGVSVKDDGSGTITLVEAIDQKAFADSMKQFGDMLGGAGGANSPTDIFSEKDVDRSKLPEGSKVESYKDGNFVGVKIMAPFAKADDVLPTLNKVANALDSTGGLNALGGNTPSKPTTSSGSRATPTPTKSSSSGQTPADSFDKFTIAKTDGGWRFEATAKSIGASGVGDDQMSQALMGAILKDASVTFSLRLPGKVTQTNADSNKNGELKWNLPLTSSAPKTMTAVTSGSGTSDGGGDSDGGFPVLLIVGAVVAVVVVGGLYYMSKNKKAAPPAPPMAPPPAAPTA